MGPSRHDSKLRRPREKAPGGSKEASGEPGSHFGFIVGPLGPPKARKNKQKQRLMKLTLGLLISMIMILKIEQKLMTKKFYQVFHTMTLMHSKQKSALMIKKSSIMMIKFKKKKKAKTKSIQLVTQKSNLAVKKTFKSKLNSKKKVHILMKKKLKSTIISKKFMKKRRAAH